MADPKPESIIVDNYAYFFHLGVMDSMSEIMTALRAGRAMLGLSQEELGALAGLSRSVIARIEKLEPNVMVDTLERVRIALEEGGVVFLDSSVERGPAVAMARIGNVAGAE